MRRSAATVRDGRRPGATRSGVALLYVLVGTALSCGEGPIGSSPPPAPPAPPPIVPPPAIPPLAQTPMTAFVDVTVIPMNGPGTLDRYTVVVEDGAISAVGPTASTTIPEGAVIIDGRGEYLIPGLADMHTHVATETSLDAGPGQLLLYLANGVTTILNQGDFGAPLPEWGNRIRAGEMMGPTVYSARYARDVRDGDPPNVHVLDPVAAAAWVADAKRDGYQFIKVYNWTRRDVFERLVSEAERQGLAVIGHIPIDVGWSAALSSGMVMVSHAGFGGFFNTAFRSAVAPARIPAVVQRTRESGVWVNPTIAVEEAVRAVWGGNAAGEAAVFAQPGVEYAHPATLARWRTKLFTQRLYNPPGSVPGGRDAIVAFIEEYTAALHDAGVRLLAGSDSPTVLLMAGYTMRNELLALAGLGLDRFEALETATRNPGDFIAATVEGAEPFGTIEVGARADLVLLDEDPLADLNHVFDRRAGVMARGVWVSETELRSMLEALRSN